MSLLGTQVFASTQNPIWLSSEGGQVNNSIIIRTPGAVEFVDDVGTITGRIVGVPAPPGPPIGNPSLYIQSPDQILFGKPGSSQANTVLAIDEFNGEDYFQVNGVIEATQLSLQDSQTVGQGQIEIGSSSVTIPFTTPPLGFPYLYITRTGASSAGPGKGNGQGTLIWENITATDFTVSLVDADGITLVAQDTPAQFVWLAINPVA